MPPNPLIIEVKQNERIGALLHFPVNFHDIFHFVYCPSELKLSLANIHTNYLICEKCWWWPNTTKTHQTIIIFQ